MKATPNKPVRGSGKRCSIDRLHDGPFVRDLCRRCYSWVRSWHHANVADWNRYNSRLDLAEARRQFDPRAFQINSPRKKMRRAS